VPRAPALEIVPEDGDQQFNPTHAKMPVDQEIRGVGGYTSHHAMARGARLSAHNSGYVQYAFTPGAGSVPPLPSGEYSLLMQHMYINGAPTRGACVVDGRTVEEWDVPGTGMRGVKLHTLVTGSFQYVSGDPLRIRLVNRGGDRIRLVYLGVIDAGAARAGEVVLENERQTLVFTRGGSLTRAENKARGVRCSPDAPRHVAPFVLRWLDRGEQPLDSVVARAFHRSQDGNELQFRYDVSGGLVKVDFTVRLGAGETSTWQITVHNRSSRTIVEEVFPRLGKLTLDEMPGREALMFPVALDRWKGAIATANRLRPDFVVVGGDLLNAHGDPAKRDAAETERMVAAYLDAAKALDTAVPLYNVAGNHDVGNTPTPEAYAWYEERFGKPWYSFEHKGSLFFVLESNVLKHPERMPGVAEKELAWLEKALREARGDKYAHRIVFMHHPFCLKSIAEKEAYENLSKETRSRLLALFKDHWVEAVFSGHFHGNRRVDVEGIDCVITNAVAKSLRGGPPGFRIVKVTPDGIEHAFHSWDDAPERLP
jgi:Icc-related predicted phosphoesterase